MDAQRGEVVAQSLRPGSADGSVRAALARSELISVEAWLAELRPATAVTGPVLQPSCSTDCRRASRRWIVAIGLRGRRRSVAWPPDTMPGPPRRPLEARARIIPPQRRRREMGRAREA